VSGVHDHHMISNITWEQDICVINLHIQLELLILAPAEETLNNSEI